MSNVFVDGFGLYGTGDTSVVADNMLAGVYAEVGNARCGISTLPWDATDTDLFFYAQTTTTTNLRLALAAGATDPIIVSMYYAVDALPSANGKGYAIAFLDGSNVVICKLVCQSTGVLALMDKNGTVLASTSGPVVVAQSAAHLEMKLNVSGTAFTLKVNETQVMNVSSLALTGSGSTEQIGFVAGANGSGAPTQYVGNIIIRDTNGSYNNDFVGDRRVATLLVNSDDDAHQGWTAQYRQRFGTGILDNRANNNSGVTAASSTQTDLGGGDFTIEMSVRFDVLPTGTNKAVLFGKWDETNNRRSYQLYKGGDSLETGNLVFRISTDGLAGTVSEIFSWPWSPDTDTWYHVAVVRSSGEVLLFIDGVQQGVAFADANTYFAGASLTSIGGQGEGTSTIASNTATNGFFDEVRLTVGVARYTSDFTPPTDKFPRGSGSDPDWSSVALLSGFDSGIFDESSFGRTLTARNGATQLTPEDGDAAYQVLAKSSPADDTFIEAALIQATAILTQTAQPSDGETITVGTTDGSTPAVYTWKNSLTTAFQVKIGADLATSLGNLVAAINAASGAGTKFGTGTTANFDVSATALPLEQVEVTARTAGTGGNSIACSTTDADGAWDGSTLSGGEDIPGYSQFGFQRPPNDTTVIDSVTLVHRDWKTDSGTATVRASFVGAGGAANNGTANNVTTTPIYYSDTFETDPDTGVGLTVSSVVGGKVKINRTA